MKHFIPNSLIVLALFCLIAFSQGCGKTEKVDDHGHDHAGTHDDHAHNPKYNEVMVEFPGHKYAMEIIDENGTTGLVTAFLTDAHFEPVEVDAKEVQLNFMITGSPKSFKLTRKPQEAGKPATFTLIDMELAALNCEGWEGEATATVNIGGTPYTSKLVKLGHDDHDHDDHAH